MFRRGNPFVRAREETSSTCGASHLRAGLSLSWPSHVHIQPNLLKSCHLIRRGWKQSDIDSCLFMKDNVILILYVDDAVLISPDLSRIKACVQSLKEDFALTDDGPLHDYFGHAVHSV